MENWGHFFAVSIAVLAIALIVGVAMWSHARSASSIYSSTLIAHHDGSSVAADYFFNNAVTDITNTGDNAAGATAEAASKLLLDLGREGARWAYDSHRETIVWASIIVVILVLVLGWHLGLVRGLFKY